MERPKRVRQRDCCDRGVRFCNAVARGCTRERLCHKAIRWAGDEGDNLGHRNTTPAPLEPISLAGQAGADLDKEVFVTVTS